MFAPESGCRNGLKRFNGASRRGFAAPPCLSSSATPTGRHRTCAGEATRSTRSTTGTVSRPSPKQPWWVQRLEHSQAPISPTLAPLTSSETFLDAYEAAARRRFTSEEVRSPGLRACTRRRTTPGERFCSGSHRLPATHSALRRTSACDEAALDGLFRYGAIGEMQLLSLRL